MAVRGDPEGSSLFVFVWFSRQEREEKTEIGRTYVTLWLKGNTGTSNDEDFASERPAIGFAGKASNKAWKHDSADSRCSIIAK